MKLFEKKKVKTLPLLAIHNLVLFPNAVLPVYVAKSAALKSVETAMAAKRQILLSYLKEKAKDPNPDTLYETCTVGRIIQIMKLPNGSSRVLVEGQERAALESVQKADSSFEASFSIIDDDNEIKPEILTQMKALQKNFQTYASKDSKIPKEILSSIEQAENPNRLINLICSQVQFSFDQKLELLKETNTEKRLELCSFELETEREVLELKNNISKRVKKRLEDHQKEYFLSEQIKEMNKELGKEDDDSNGVKGLEKRFEEGLYPEEIQEKAKSELKRLKRLQAMTPESGIIRSYLEWLADLPWGNKEAENISINESKAILDEDHYDMKEPKERILDYIAVLQLKPEIKGPILCMVGPPGTGKTSLAKSLARALDRDFVRISLGGVRDEAEIRGHRRTYVGALPGKIIQGMKKAGSANPVFLLDEIDKLASDYRGDPASALLEVLDPEQNKNFADHYLEVTYDLSRVLFVTTANSLHSIPLALRDRMEVIQIPGYTSFDKTKIAKQFIIPKQIKENGLDWVDIKFQDTAIKSIISEYTMESGVRNLERELGKVMRKLARKIIEDKVPIPSESYQVKISKKDLADHLGKPKFKDQYRFSELPPGMANGLAWTELGGKMLAIETRFQEGKGELILTGNLGDVMKESARIALSLVESLAESIGIKSSEYKDKTIHIHVPEGAIPKDGPSAGVTLTVAIISALWGRSLPHDLAMTGEITLTGRVLAVGGIKEKVLAAHRHNIKEVILPKANKDDKDELPPEVKRSIKFTFVENAEELVKYCFKDV
jgi:ATP-dependent Lon protease